MRAEDNNIFDLNNLPDDPSIDHFSFFKEGSSPSSSSGGFREKHIKDGKEYKCRFCSLKFLKSQALGGHMNRHRQERESESLNKARELVLRNNDTFPPHPSFSYHHGDLHRGDPIRPYKPMMYPPRLLSPSTLMPPPPPLLAQTYLYPPPYPPRPLSLYRPTNDCFLNNSGTHHQNLTNSGCRGRSPPESGYTIGAPVGNGSTSSSWL